MSTETITREDVQLYTCTDAANHAHRVRVADRGVPRLIVGPVEALCGYRFTLTGRKGLPPCPNCEAVYADDEAMGLAND